MADNEQKTMFVVLALITTPKLADQAAEVFRAKALPVQYRFNAEGTASNEIMDMFGFGSIDKCILLSVMLKPFADSILKRLHAELHLSTANSGIAFTVPLTGANSLLLRMIKQTQDPVVNSLRKENSYMSDAKHSLIAAVVKRGFSGDVMNAARAAGARGGTVIHSLSVGNDEIAGLWNMKAQDESDIVLIIADAEDKVDLMRAISEKCGVNSDAKGLIMSLPLDAVTGF